MQRNSHLDAVFPTGPGKPCVLDHAHSSPRGYLVTGLQTHPGDWGKDDTNPLWLQRRQNTRFSSPRQVPLGCYKGGGKRVKHKGTNSCLLVIELLWRFIEVCFVRPWTRQLLRSISMPRTTLAEGIHEFTASNQVSSWHSLRQWPISPLT